MMEKIHPGSNSSSFIYFYIFFLSQRAYCQNFNELILYFRRKNENQLAKLAIVTLAAGVLTLGSVGDAFAAKSGGRVGGQAFRSSAPRSTPRSYSRSR